MRLAVALLLFAGLGCDSVFGLQHIDGPPDGQLVAPDLPDTYVTGRRSWHLVTNDPQRRPMLAEVPLPTPWTVELDDGTRPTVTMHDDGSFEFARAHAGQAYRLIASTNVFEVQHTSASLELAQSYYGRLERDPVTPGTTLGYTVPNAVQTATTVAYVNTTGLWSSTQAPNVSSFTLDWTKQGSLSGPAGLLRVDENDRAFYILDDNVGGYTATIGYRADDITIPAGGTPAITGAYSAAVRDSCIHVLANHASVAARLTQAGMTGSKVANWIVRSVPIAANGPFVGFATASAGQVGTLSNVDMNMMTANPYPGHDLVLSQSVFAARTFTAPGATAATLYEGSQHYVIPATSCAAPTVLDGAAAIPSDFMIDGVPLTADGQPLAVPRPGSITFSFRADGAADRYRVDVYEIFKNASAATGFRLVTQIYSQKTDIRIDSSLLQAGGSYTLLGVAEVGYPTAPVGDTAT
ncbi:MAG: hypothetical protein HOV81_39410, partial [Kofleriaceae bacterium]|nr:hypothetical protein [Kofleriaceae bacterium]